MPLSERALCFSGAALVHAALLYVLTSARPAAFPVADSTVETSRPLIARVLFESTANTAASGPLTSSIQVASQIAIEVSAPAPIEAIASDSFHRSRPVANALDATEVERLQGIYRGQLLARVARLLEIRGGVPRNLNGKCVVNVVQNERGDVLDVMTDLCALSQEGQAVIANAIRSASPLPLPPAGLATGSYLSLDLSGI